MVNAQAQTIIEELSSGECVILLETHRVGRVAIVRHGQPEIFPVNYRCDGGTVVFRTNAGLKLSQSDLHLVAFEIDDFMEGDHTGWSVMVKGVGHDITDSFDTRAQHLQSLTLDPWAPGERHNLVQVTADEITGRRIRVRQGFDGDPTVGS